MAKHCPANERIKREYFLYLKEAQRYSDASIDTAAAAIAGFEHYTNYTNFKRFHIQQPIAFKRRLASKTNPSTGRLLSLATQRSTLMTLRNFFIWLAGQPGYKSAIRYGDADYFNLSERDNRIAQSHTPRPFPSLEQARHIIKSMPSATVIERRDQSLVAFTLMTGCRDRATVSLKLKHIDLSQKRVTLDAREVKTKNAKSFTTFFMPVGNDIFAVFEAWFTALTTDHLWGPDDPLFPAPLMTSAPLRGSHASGLKREHWTTANPVRRIFRSACENAGLPYFNPHSFRHTLGQLGQQVCSSPEEFKACDPAPSVSLIITRVCSGFGPPWTGLQTRSA